MTGKLETTEANSWHAMEIGPVFNLLESQPQGLMQDEAQRRLAAYGPNRLRPPKRRSPGVLSGLLARRMRSMVIDHSNQLF